MAPRFGVGQEAPAKCRWLQLEVPVGFWRCKAIQDARAKVLARRQKQRQRDMGFSESAIENKEPSPVVIDPVGAIDPVETSVSCSFTLVRCIC